MSPIREVCLSLTEVDDLIRSFEEKYKISTPDLLLDADLRSQLPEDDLFQWEAFYAHKRELVRNEETLRAAYLEKVKQAPPDASPTAPERQNQNLALAA